jgi:hypothetical protein
VINSRSFSADITASELSEDELEKLVTAFQLHKSEQEAPGQIERPTSLH